MSRVLIIEDHEDIAEGILDHLKHGGFHARIASTGLDGVRVALSWEPDVVILDLMLPDISGYDVLNRIRQKAPDLPVLILSARSDEMTKVKGFREGADDYVTKPFGLHELAARLFALTRRTRRRQPASPLADTLESGPIRLDTLSRRVFRSGVELILRPKEYELLLALMRNSHAVLSRKDLLRTVWAYEPGVASRTVDWHVAELRRKLGDDAEAPSLIATIRKAGYRWAAPILPPVGAETSTIDSGRRP